VQRIFAKVGSADASLAAGPGGRGVGYLPRSSLGGLVAENRRVLALDVASRAFSFENAGPPHMARKVQVVTGTG